MMSLVVYDVPGDGHCYYSCVEALLRQDARLASKMGIGQVGGEGEGKGGAVGALRALVATRLRRRRGAQQLLLNLLELHRQDSSLEEYYPLLRFAKPSFEESVHSIAERIARSNLMASSIEHEIMNAELREGDEPRVTILVLSKEGREVTQSVVRKWICDLQKLLAAVSTAYVAVFVNDSNAHYLYAELGGKCVIRRRDLHAYIVAQQQF